MKVAIEPHIYYHTQTPGYQVRKVVTEDGRVVLEKSKYFSCEKYGHREAKRKARNWKKYKLMPFFRGMGLA